MNRFLRLLYLQGIRVKTLRAYRGGDWRKLPIRENGEPLIEVQRDICYPYYAKEMKLVEDERVFLRATALENLLKARRSLMEMGYDLKVYDGWRSVTLQENLFWYYLKEFTVAKFDLVEAFKDATTPDLVRAQFLQLSDTMQTTLREANRTYVSWPSSDPIAPSPHATGGAVDVWLYQEDRPVNLGVPFDWMEEDAGAFYHMKFNRKRFAGNDRLICGHRELLLLAMARSGFSCYGPEIWHFNFGNQMHALVEGGSASYSYIEP